jgi:hypothetical protein
MVHEKIQIQYNQDLKSLETLLSSVRRPGNFFIKDSKEMPMPKIEVKDVGILSFPIPEDQIKRLIQQAALAPYGRGEKTILDTSIRKVWQLTPEKVQISGSSWEIYFKEVLSRVKKGLGCQDIPITAELYKMLIYDKGGFFLPHRDTEKSPGMFGTLVIVLPSFHQGGELIIRHQVHEVTLNLSSFEVSELTFAAFYADCEHEVLPVKEGNRVCLIYNLLQQQDTKESQKLLTPPFYETEIAEAAKLLENALTKTGAPIKIAWLLEHQYSPAGLSFKALKNADSALAQVLSEAALRAGCTIHLGIVHIEESGSAEPHYDSYSRRSRWRNDDDEEESCSEDFDIIDVCDTQYYIDGWIHLKDQPIDFGELPLQEGELLPSGILDHEPPDEKRLIEATGNEGASYERSYHRAALVIWRNGRYPEVLLQAGTAAIMPYFKECVETDLLKATSKEPRKALHLLTNIILGHWETHLQPTSFRNKSPDRSEMFRLLSLLKEPSLLERFIANIVCQEYDGSENEALIAAIEQLHPEKVSHLFSQLVSSSMSFYPGAVVNLFHQLVEKNAIDKDTAFQIGLTVVNTLKEIGMPSSSSTSLRHRYRRQVPIDSSLVVDLWSAFIRLKASTLSDVAVTEIIDRPSVFDPGKIVLPALRLLYERYQEALLTETSVVRLWQHTAEFLLARSEYPPKPPEDWRQLITLSCH